MIIDSPIISGSYSASGSLNQFGNVVISGSLTVTGSIIGTASFAETASYLSGYVSPFPFTGSAIISGSLDVTGSLKVTGSITTTGTLTAQTLVVQTVSSSVIYSSGSNIFGNDLANTQVLTGSVSVTGSLAVNGSNAILTNQTSSMSASYALNATSASYANNANSASYATTASFSLNVPVTASYANNANSASYATTASFSLNVPVTSSYANNANSASYADTASFVTTAQTASYVLNAVSSSFATSASNALTASYLSGYVSPFPFTGSAIISGSLTVTGSVAVSNLSGSGVRYLVADESGSITAQSASAALKSTQAFTSTAGQTTFSVTNGYATGYVDVFINGSKLSTAEFTDTSGTNIVLATGSFINDTVEVVKYTPAAGVTNNVLRQLTTFTASAGQTVFSASYTPGLLDIFYNGSRLSPSDFTANNGTFFTLATGSAVNDILDVLVYSYQVGAFSGIGGVGTAAQVAYFDTTNSITGSPNFTISGSTMLITGSLTISGSSTFTNIGPAVFSGSLTSTAGFTGSFSGTATSASYAANAELLDGLDSSVFTLTSSFAAQTASFTAFTSSQLILNGTYATTGSNTFAGIQTINSNLTVTGSITAQTLIVSTINATQSYSSGSNIFGNASSNTQTFTGSVNISGSSHSIIGNTTITSGPGSTLLLVKTSNNIPAITFTGATYSAAIDGGDYLGFSTSGSYKLYINASGSVGIGTSSPTRLFEVSSAGTTYARVSTTTNSVNLDILTTTSAGWLGTQSTHDLMFQTSNTERMRITSGSGNVGIGETNPNSPLSVTATSTAAAVSTGVAYIVNNGTGNGLQVTTSGTAGTSFIFKARSSGVDRFWVGDTGNVGIGVTPASVSKLQVKVATDINLSIRTAVNQTGAVVIQGISDSANDNIPIEYRASIHSFPIGNVLIGSTTDSGIKLQVTGGGKFTGTVEATGFSASAEVTIQKAGANGIGDGPYYRYINSTNSYQFLRQLNASSGEDLWTYTTSWTKVGNTNAGSGVYTALSDVNKKKDFELSTLGLDAILGLKPTLYRMKSEDETLNKQLGFIAQEVKDFIPQAFIEQGDDDDKFIGLNYNAITATLVKAIQEQQAIITSLQDRLERNNII